MRSVSDVHIFSTVSVTLIWKTGFVQSFKGSILPGLGEACLAAGQTYLNKFP